MEKSWENFWTTGKVEDYLTYRNRVDENEEKNQKKQNSSNEPLKNGQGWKGF